MQKQNGSGTQTVSHEITAKLTRRIFDQRYPAGSKLPTERELAAEFGVARHVVREALKRLEAVGLVRIRQGSGIHVESLHLSGNIDVFDFLLTQDDGSVNVAMLKDIIEFRIHMTRVVMRLAVTRRTDEQMEAIKAAFEKWQEARNNDPSQREEASLRLFQIFAESTHNRVFILIFNTMGRIFLKLRDLVDIPLLGFEQTEALLTRIIDAFEHKDEDMADLLVTRYLEAIQQTLNGQDKGI